MSSSVEAGVHLYDTSAGGAIWVYLPLEKVEDHPVALWRCDVLTVFPSGEVHCRGDVLHSEKYLSGMFKDLHV